MTQVAEERETATSLVVAPCRFCAAPAVAVYRLDAGCACYPDDREQALCEQHIVKATPLGPMELVRLLAEPLEVDRD